MSLAFENAKKFFTACEAPLGWEGCKEFVAEGASFQAQSEPLATIATVEAYTNWLHGLVHAALPGATYEVHATSYDEATRTALFFATFHATHSGAGGPVPATNQQTHTHYVYALTMDANNRVERMVKIWNAPWALRELGWAS
jgi:hypothetical protein